MLTLRQDAAYVERFVASLSVQNVLRGHQGCVNSIEFSESGDLLLTGSDDKCVCVYATCDEFELRGKFPLRHSANIFHAVFLPRQPGVVLSCALDGATVLTDLASGDARTSDVVLSNPRTLASKVACHRSWIHTAFVGYGDGNVVWIDTRLPRREQSAVVARWNPHGACVEEINALAVHDAHPFTLCVGTNTHLVYLMDVRKINSGRPCSALGTIRIPPVAQRDTEGIGGLSFSSTGSTLCVNFKSNDVFTVPLVAAGLRGAGAAAAAHVEEQHDLDFVQFRGRKNNRTMFKEAIFCFADQVLATGGDCGHVFFWRSKDGTLVHKTRGDGDIVNGVLAHEALPTVVCAGIDSTTKVLASTGSLQEPAKSASRETFGGQRLGRHHGDSDDEDNEDDNERSEQHEGLLQACELANLAAWRTLRAEQQQQRPEEQGESAAQCREEIRILCAAFLRHLHLFDRDSEGTVPMFVLKRMVAIVQAVRRMRSRTTATTAALQSSELAQEDDDDEAPSSEEDVEESLLAPTTSDDDDEGDAEADEEAVDDSDASGSSSSDGVDISEGDDEAEESRGAFSDEGRTTLLSVFLMLVKTLLATLDAQLRATVDDSGSPIFSLHWFSCSYGGFGNCEALPLAARRAKLMLLVLEGLLLDKRVLFTPNNNNDVLASTWKKLACGVLLRRLYVEMASSNLLLCQELLELLASSPAFNGLVALGEIRRPRAASRESTVACQRVVAVALTVRFLKLSGSEYSTALQSLLELLVRSRSSHRTVRLCRRMLRELQLQ